MAINWFEGGQRIGDLISRITVICSKVYLANACADEVVIRPMDSASNGA